MRFTVICFCFLFGFALSKTVTKALTESLGQEVIEIGAPLKELPADLEEEPSNEKEDDDAPKSSVAPATKRELQKAPLAQGADGRRKMKDVDRIDGLQQEEDEQRVEKELADIYKDNNDYRAESNEQKASGETNENILRQKSGKSDFVFAPKDINNPKQVEKFRTSPDYIDCKRKLINRVTNYNKTGCLPG